MATAAAYALRPQLPAGRPAGLVCSVDGPGFRRPAFFACAYCTYISAAAVVPPPRMALRCSRSSQAAMMMNSAAWPTPRCTHFISVPARVAALISVVCGELHAAAMISYTMPADTRNATPLPLRTAVLMSATGSPRPGDDGQVYPVRQRRLPVRPGHVPAPLGSRRDAAAVGLLHDRIRVGVEAVRDLLQARRGASRRGLEHRQRPAGRVAAATGPRPDHRVPGALPLLLVLLLVLVLVAAPAV